MGPLCLWRTAPLQLYKCYNTYISRTANGQTQPWSAVYGLHLRNLCNYTGYYSLTDPEEMKGWVCLIGWPIADTLPTKKSHKCLYVSFLAVMHTYSCCHWVGHACVGGRLPRNGRPSARQPIVLCWVFKRLRRPQPETRASTTLRIRCAWATLRYTRCRTCNRGPRTMRTSGRGRAAVVAVQRRTIRHSRRRLRHIYTSLLRCPCITNTSSSSNLHLNRRTSTFRPWRDCQLGDPQWHTQKGRVGVSNPHWIFRILKNVFLHKIVSGLCSYSH